MGSLVSLLIYLAIATAAVGALYAGVQGVRHWVAAPFVEAQKASDQKFVDAASANAKSAELERDNAKNDTAQCTAIIGKQNDAIALWKSAADRNIAASKEAKTQAMKEATAQAPVIADLQAKAAAAPKLMVCEEELGKSKEILRDVLRVRRGLPTGPAAPPALVK